ncbi:MAG: pseudaminic acid cytidylyltransferase [Candidatus Omnitrophota bacterium]
MLKALAIIPARGGSKRLPGKNIRSFYGRPVIEYSIRAAQQAGCFEEIMVSTDDPAIAAVATSCGAAVPFLRSAQNASDTSSTADALLEVLAGYRQMGREFPLCCCIYPAAPLVSFKRLRQAYELLLSSSVDSVFPVLSFGYPIWRALKLEGGKARMIWPEHAGARSQDLPPAFHDAGQFYFLRTARFLLEQKLFMADSRVLEIPSSEGQDIDTEEDWKIAEAKFGILSKGGL